MAGFPQIMVCVDGAGHASMIQAAIIEDLGDPKGPQLQQVGKGTDRQPMLPPRLRLWCELAGIAFERSLYGDADQRAWETCRDPFRMLRALAQVGEEAPIRVVTKGVQRFVNETLDALKAADPWDCPDARIKLVHLTRVLSTSGSIKEVCEVAVRCRVIVDEDPAALLAHKLYMELPAAPHRFSDEPLDSAEQVRRLGVIVRRLQPPEIRWLEQLSLQVLRQGKQLSPSDSARADQLLRRRGAWRIFCPW